MTPPLSTYRYASPRQPDEGLRIGVARHAPRGVRKQDRPSRGYFDLWLPLLAPSAELVSAFRKKELSWAGFSRSYRKSMRRPECGHVIEFVAGMSLFLPLSLGCFCEDASRCHRSLLQKLILQAAKTKQAELLERGEREWTLRPGASPVCYAGEFEDLEI